MMPASYDRWLEEPIQRRYRHDEACEAAWFELAEDPQFDGCQRPACTGHDPCAGCVERYVVEVYGMPH